jgi:hypothetical protein
VGGLDGLGAVQIHVTSPPEGAPSNNPMPLFDANTLSISDSVTRRFSHPSR